MKESEVPRKLLLAANVAIVLDDNDECVNRDGVVEIEPVIRVAVADMVR